MGALNDDSENMRRAGADALRGQSFLDQLIDAPAQLIELFIFAPIILAPN